MSRPGGLVIAVTIALLLPAVGGSAPAPTQTPGVLVVGVNLGEPGFQVGAVVGTKVVLSRGFEIDLTRALAKRLEIGQVQFVHEPIFSRLYAAGPKTWDVAVAQITITPARRANVDFSVPYLAADQGVLLAEGVAQPKSLADLQALQLCAQRGTTSAAAIVSKVQPTKVALLFDKQEGLLDALFQRRCGAVIDDAPILGALRRQAPDRYGRLVARLGTPESYAFALPKGSTLRPLLNQALGTLKQDGTLATLEKRWLGTDMAKLPVLARTSLMLRHLRISNLVLIREAELELAAGLNAITGETGAGKTIFTNAIGLLLGARGDAALIGAAGAEAYVEAEFEHVDDELLGPLAELRPDDEEGVVLARRIFADGRTRAYAWGRSAAREDVAAAAEAMLAMSGQFEQRRLAKPAYQRGVLDTFAAVDIREAQRAWRDLQAARRAYDELTQDAAAAAARLAELRALAEDTAGLEAGQEDELRAERERLRHVTELAQAADGATTALAPEDGNGATDLVAAAERAVAPYERLAPELASAGDALRQAELQLRETASELRGFLDSLEAEPGRLEQLESELDRLADLKRRYRAQTLPDLLERAEAARDELAALDGGRDPAEAAEAARDAAAATVARIHAELRAARHAAAEPFAGAVATELAGIGLGDGEFRVEVADREPGASGADEIRFLIRPNQGLPFGPVAETASGGELSRIALAIAAVAGGETMVFDEIDAGIGGTTAHAVAETLRRLAERAQVVTITHLPQIASVADRHFRVEKVAGDPTHTQIEQLGDLERRDEVERMLGGAEFLASLDR